MPDVICNTSPLQYLHQAGVLRDPIVAEGAEHHLAIKQKTDVFAVVSDGLGK